MNTAQIREQQVATQLLNQILHRWRNHSVAMQQTRTKLETTPWYRWNQKLNLRQTLRGHRRGQLHCSQLLRQAGFWS